MVEDISNSKCMQFVEMKSGRVVMGSDYEDVAYHNISQVMQVWDEDEKTSGENYEGVIPQRWVDGLKIDSYYKPEKHGVWVPFGMIGDFLYELRRV